MTEGPAPDWLAHLDSEAVPRQPSIGNGGDSDEESITVLPTIEQPIVVSSKCLTQYELDADVATLLNQGLKYVDIMSHQDPGGPEYGISKGQLINVARDLARKNTFAAFDAATTLYHLAGYTSDGDLLLGIVNSLEDRTPKECLTQKISLASHLAHSGFIVSAMGVVKGAERIVREHRPGAELGRAVGILRGSIDDMGATLLMQHYQGSPYRLTGS